MCRTIATGVILHEAAADGTARLELGSRRINLHPRPVLIELECKETSRVGRERYRGSSHEFGEHFGGLLRVSRSDREMMDHAFLPNSVADDSTTAARSPMRPDRLLRQSSASNAITLYNWPARTVTETINLLFLFISQRMSPQRWPDHAYRAFSRAAKNWHQPVGLMLPATIRQVPGGLNRRQMAQRCWPLGWSWYFASVLLSSSRASTGPAVAARIVLVSQVMPLMARRRENATALSMKPRVSCFASLQPIGSPDQVRSPVYFATSASCCFGTCHST